MADAFLDMLKGRCRAHDRERSKAVNPLPQPGYAGPGHAAIPDIWYNLSVLHIHQSEGIHSV